MAKSSRRKIAVIGSGLVGGTTAYSLMLGGFVEEIVLLDVNKKLLAAQVMDLQHAVPFGRPVKITAGDYADLADSSVVVIACGLSQHTGQSRLALTQANARIIAEVVPRVFQANADARVIMVTNPVDLMTYLAVKLFPEKQRQIIGTGTMLDSARLRFLLGQELGVDPHSLHAYIVGEHGDSEVPLWSTATVGNVKLDDFHPLAPTARQRIFRQAKNAAYAIIAGKQATYYAISAGVAALARAILFDQRSVLAVSSLTAGEYGLRGIALSLPSVIGAGGILGKLLPAISDRERLALRASAEALKTAAAILDKQAL